MNSLNLPQRIGHLENFRWKIRIPLLVHPLEYYFILPADIRSIKFDLGFSATLRSEEGRPIKEISGIRNSG